MKRLKILLDMDDTLYDFKGAVKDKENRGPPEMFVEGFFRNLKPKPGAELLVKKLIARGHDVYICTRPLASHPICYADKAYAIRRDFPDLSNKIIMCQDKGMISADVLVDDCPTQLGSFMCANKRGASILCNTDDLKGARYFIDENVDIFELIEKIAKLKSKE